MNEEDFDALDAIATQAYRDNPSPPAKRPRIDPEVINLSSEEQDHRVKELKQTIIEKDGELIIIRSKHTELEKENREKEIEFFKEKEALQKAKDTERSDWQKKLKAKEEEIKNRKAELGFQVFIIYCI
jgi:hypothetical protein